MNMNKRNQTIAIARYLAYKISLNRRLEGMSEDDYIRNPIGLDVGQYIDDLMKYCPESMVDNVMNNTNSMIMRLGEEQINVLAFMPFEGSVVNA